MVSPSREPGSLPARQWHRDTQQKDRGGPPPLLNKTKVLRGANNPQPPPLPELHACCSQAASEAQNPKLQRGGGHRCPPIPQRAETPKLIAAVTPPQPLPHPPRPALTSSGGRSGSSWVKLCSTTGLLSPATSSLTPPQRLRARRQPSNILSGAGAEAWRGGDRRRLTMGSAAASPAPRSAAGPASAPGTHRGGAPRGGGGGWG